MFLVATAEFSWTSNSGVRHSCEQAANAQHPMHGGRWRARRLDGIDDDHCAEHPIVA
jgi:hypothetical protein